MRSFWRHKGHPLFLTTFGQQANTQFLTTIYLLSPPSSHFFSANCICSLKHIVWCLIYNMLIVHLTAVYKELTFRFTHTHLSQQPFDSNQRNYEDYSNTSIWNRLSTYSIIREKQLLTPRTSSDTNMSRITINSYIHRPIDIKTIYKLDFVFHYSLTHVYTVCCIRILVLTIFNKEAYLTFKSWFNKAFRLL